MPELAQITIVGCQGIKWLGVAGQCSASSSAEQLHQEKIGQQEQEAGGEGGDGVLLLPPQLQTLLIFDCPELSLLSNSLEGDREGCGLQGLRSLQSLDFRACPKLLHSYSSSSFPFPTSLQKLHLDGCGEFRGEGICPLLAHGHRIVLSIEKTSKFFAGSEPHNEEFLPCSFAHRELELWTDDVAGLLAVHICKLLSSSLAILVLHSNQDAERFTHEQKEAFRHLTSLKTLGFYRFKKLKCLPTGLHRLTSLKTLKLSYCGAIRSLPEDGLPSSLQRLYIGDCPAFDFELLPKDGFPSSLQRLDISNCPALKSLPKNDGLPSSLQELHIWYCPALESLPKDGLPSSLQKLRISACDAIKLIPKGSLPSSLQELEISRFSALMSLPKDGLPSSLAKLELLDCPALKSLPEDGLPRSLQELKISNCAAINSLPKGGLPRSLQVLDVSDCDNEELKRQCRKLRGTIPKIITS